MSDKNDFDGNAVDSQVERWVVELKNSGTIIPGNHDFRLESKPHVKEALAAYERAYLLSLSLISKHNPKTPASETPLNAEFILHLFLKKDELDAFIGDLHEKYAKKCERFGVRRAKFWYYSEVARSLWPLAKRFVAKSSGLIALGEWIRRHVS